jgi:hypothetical protein
MPTILEIAQERERAKLARAGLNPDGTPMGAAPNPNDDDDDDDDNDQQQQRQSSPPDDATAQEIADLRRQLAAAQGRVAPTQQSLEEYRRLWEGERAARTQRETELTQQIEALRQAQEQRETSQSVEELLTDEEKRDIDPLVLQAMTKIASAMAERRLPKTDVRASTLQVLEEREAQRVQNYRNTVMTDPTRGLHQLSQLAFDPEFIAWSREDDNDVESVVTSLLSSKSTEDVDRYAKIVAKRITKFRNRNKGQTTDVRTSLGSHMRRGEPQRLTDAEVKRKLDEAKNLSRSPRLADRQKAQQILSELS